jgi:DNA-binding CsgD family transcriptional regulator/tetratricopeptide (TPR) repeat protein
MDETACLAALNKCFDDDYLAPDGHVFRFAHPLVRHVTYRLIIVPRRERLHLAIAQALEELYGDRLDEHISEIANHLLAAGSQADAELVVEHTKRAADAALGVFAWRQAARYYEAAIGAAESSRQFSPHDVAELQFRAGYSCYRDMDPGPSEDHYERAIEGFRETGDDRSLVRAHADLTRLHLTLASVPYGKLVDLDPIQQVLPQLSSKDDDVRAKALELMSSAYWHARMPEEAARVAGEAFELARASGDEFTAARALSNRGMAHLSNLHLEEALSDFEDSVEIARPLGDPLVLGLPLPRICPVLITMGRLNSAEVYIQEACEVISQAGDWGGLSVALAYRISHCYFKGDFDGVERYALQGLQAARRSRYTWGAAVFLPTLASARSQRGETDEALDAIQALTLPGNIIDDPGATLNAIGLIFGTLVSAEAGDLGPARARLPSMIAAAKAAGRRDIQSMAPYCALVEISAHLDDPESADTWYEPLQFARQRGAVLCSSWGFLVPRVLGLISSLNERWDEADAHFADALEISGRIGARGELGRALLDYAGMLARRGLRDDRKGATQMIEQATAIFAGLGMRPLVARAEALAASLGAQGHVVVEPDASRYPGNLSRREVEVLLLLSRGFTNKRIAEELVLSTKTVARHISNIFGKIEVDNRSGATAYAFEHGLAGRIDQEGRRI